MSIKNISFDNIMARIKEHFEFEYDTELASLLGFKQPAFSLRRKDGSIPFEELFVLAEKERLSTDWIFFGRGKPEEDGFDQTTPEEKELIEKFLKVYRNPATKRGIASTLDAMAKVPLSDVEPE